MVILFFVYTNLRYTFHAELCVFYLKLDKYLLPLPHSHDRNENKTFNEYIIAKVLVYINFCMTLNDLPVTIHMY